MLANVFKCEERQGLPFPYRLGSLLGVGGMGVVYELENPSSTDLAVKFVHPGVDDPQAAQAMLEREAHLEMHLQGLPVAVQTLALWKVGLQQINCYKVMRRIEGEALRTPVDLRWRNPVIQALSQIHHRGIVHGDLKPANIICSHLGKIILLDFGLGRRLNEALPVGIRRAYTPQYASPRVLSGCLPEIEDDLYSVNRIFEL